MHPMPRTLAAALSTALLALLPLAAHSAANDVFPTDYIALPDRSTNLTFYLQQQSLSGPWRDGRQLAAGGLDVRLAAVRVSRHYSVGENGRQTIAPVLVLPWASGEASGLPVGFGRQASGAGDVRVGLSYWFHVDREHGEYSGLTLLATLPTGDYDPARALNVGENRHRLVLSAGLMRQLNKRWVLDLSPEVAFHGDNRAYLGNQVLSQQASYALTGWLRYRIAPALQWMGGAQINRGGATRADGVPATGAPDNTRLATGLLMFAPGRQQWILRYARDVETRNGFRLGDELTLRYLVSFN